MNVVLLLVFGLTPAYIIPVSADISVYPNLDVQKVAGKWHPIGMASKTSELTEYEQKVSPMDHTVEILDGRDMKMSAYFMSNGVCKESVYFFNHTDKPGVFDFSAGQLHIMDIDYEKYVILYTKKGSHESMFLSARGSEVGDDIKEKFKQYVLAQKFPEAHIKYFVNAVLFSSNGVCKELVRMLKHTAKPGVFDFPGGKAYIMDIDYEKYIIFYVKKEDHDSIYLSARGLEVGDDIKEKFKQYVLAQEFPEERIEYFVNAEQCTP